MLARAKAKASAAGDKARTGKDKGIAKLLTTINKLRPILRSGGYAIEAVHLSTGLPPQASLKLRNVAEVDMAALEELENRQEPPLTKTQKAIVKMLQKVERLESTCNEKGYDVGRIDLTTGLIPELTLRLLPQDPSPEGDEAAAAQDGETIDE
ncbi:uncharacterized protein AMSG_00225 [Thecamonas trahens ATCC 50062]|uniref:Uncharacterized protein n=1 Tax=Thecamonas trahens ATCC 50062 TaxID=461836 RepID=A0A0L0D490_THETB|nr:hypothetical protein AMSG_00225 [Thecamonas trahens ATCC 50062]KNC46108.1 hypothetical protein AMSG_00225 [Thecamonas trahens ATCC 50062]|eukprot:XP_013763086.1 hypothetical protein AMSG_00225 [Thecamonas trahens ATCC 50062]